MNNKVNNIALLIIHHTAVSRSKNPDQFEANNNYHGQQWNFKSSLGFYLGYHYEIAADGSIRQARAENEAGAHTMGHNYDSIGICLDGNFDIEMPTYEQEKSLKELLINLKAKYPDAKIAYHRDFAQKSCPGKLIKDNWANNLISNNMVYKIKVFIQTPAAAIDQALKIVEKWFWQASDQQILVSFETHFIEEELKTNVVKASSGFYNETMDISAVDLEQLKRISENYQPQSLFILDPAKIKAEKILTALEYPNTPITYVLAGNDPDNIAEFIIHETLHRWFNLAGQPDTVHQHSGISDPRPEANFKDIVQKLKPFWDKIINQSNPNTMLKIIKQKGTSEVFAVIAGKNYYIGSPEAFERLKREGIIGDWSAIQEVPTHIPIDGIIK